MPEFKSPYRALVDTYPHLSLALVAAFSFALVILPDLLFYWSGYQTTAVRKPESMLLAALFAVAVSLIASHRHRMAAIGGIAISQLLWLGCIAYFGKALGPEQIMLATTEAADITNGIIDGWRTLLPAFAVTALTGSVLVLLHRIPIDRSRLGRLAGSWVLVLVLAGCAGYWLTHKSIVAAVPGAQTWSGLGPFQAIVGASRLLLTPVAAAPGMKIADQDVKALPLEEEPVTIVIIMGEGITPQRLSLFGFPSETSPRIGAWRQSPPTGFEFFTKIGFAGGVATLGSVPSFLKMAYWPVEAEWRGQNLFDLAHANGFQSWFLSAQSRHFLDVAGGARNAIQVFVEQGNEGRLALKHDDVLVDLVRDIPRDSTRRFVFVHQRVNHSNYLSHCSHLSREENAALYIFKPAANSTQDRRRAAYDNGLRCWDRNVADLAELFVGQKGAVHIFITADHSEMMGEDGLWGHSMSDLRVPLVPVMLLTTRPSSDIAVRFRALKPPNAYTLSQLVARALGADITTPGANPDRFYFNNTLPFGRSGYFEVEKITPSRFAMKRYSKEGKVLEINSRDLPEVEAADKVLHVDVHE